MSGKSKINVFNKMTKTALDEEISAYVAYHKDTIIAKHIQNFQNLLKNS